MNKLLFMKKFCDTLTQLRRRSSYQVVLRGVKIGDNNPVVVQSMANCSTLDTDACVGQIAEIFDAGGRVMRFTAPSIKEGENLKNIAQVAEERGYSQVALVADIHFTPDVAFIAAESVDKVRINPGNFRNTNGEFRKLIDICRSNNTAIRVGVNHGSLSPHIVEEYGDTPKGMVASAMEFLRECVDYNFLNVVVSIKSSNVRVMVHAYRLLVAQMRLESMQFPLHLGVTEAGDALAARVKSALGIGALLVDGIGDTIRVSLTESPKNEIPVGNSIVKYFESKIEHKSIDEVVDTAIYSPYEYTRRESTEVGTLGGKQLPKLYSELTQDDLKNIESDRVVLLSCTNENCVAEWRSAILNMTSKGDLRPVILHKRYSETNFDELAIKSASDFGPLFLDGLADGIYIESECNGDSPFSPEQYTELALSILQASRVRVSMTEYIACPGCGRTLYDLQATLKEIKERTSHLKGLKIAVMGCIVNGPGEMADADYGYVGSGRGLVTLYKGKQVMSRAVLQENAIEDLIQIIKDNGDWVDKIIL